jgi:hypothetical protein
MRQHLVFSLGILCRVKSFLTKFRARTMSAPHNTEHSDVPQDAVEAIVPLMPIVLPVMGGLLMLLLAFIAVFMA